MPRRHHRDAVKEQNWRQLVRDWKASGQSRSQFCRDHSLSTHTFDFWRREIAKRDVEASDQGSPAGGESKPATAKPVLVPVRIVASPTLEVKLANGRTVSIPPGFDPKHLQSILEVLEARPD